MSSTLAKHAAHPIAAGLLLFGLAVLPVAARAAPSVAAGREIAQDVCSACHSVAPQQEFPPLLDQHVPTFQEIADNPATTAQSLHRFISTTHWDEKTIPMSMPNMMLQSGQVDQVTRYILSLRKVR